MLSVSDNTFQTNPLSLNHQIRKESIGVGGYGEFLRSARVLEMMIEDEEVELETDLLPALESVVERLAPQEKMLDELKRKFEETENAIYGVQIRPLEIRMQPLQEMKEQQEMAVLSQKDYIADLVELRDEALSSLQRFKNDGRCDVFYSGFSRTWSVDANRSFALGPDGESEFVLALVKEGFEMTAKWLPENNEQPLLVENHMKQDGLNHGIVVSFATPEEGPKRLCAVSEWFGDVKSSDVTSRTKQLLTWLKMDKLIVADMTKTLVSTWSDAIPLRRRNELWVEIVPPDGQEWFDHAAKIATNLPAKNSSLYQLKDCPWATPVPWGTKSAAALEQKEQSLGGMGEDLRVCSWAVSTSMLGGTNQLSVAVRGGAGVAVDRSSGGEIAVWSLGGDALGSAASDEEDGSALYAVSEVGGGWPIKGGAVETARLGLLQSVASDGQLSPMDPMSFRLRATKLGGPAEMWLRVEPADL